MFFIRAMILCESRLLNRITSGIYYLIYFFNIYWLGLVIYEYNECIYIKFMYKLQIYNYIFGR
jgi:uncharacterized membrane protein